MMLPTQRTLQWLRKAGYTAGVVEKWIPQTKQRKDLFGCIDIVAISKDQGCLGIQATSAANVSSRLAKCLSIPEAKLWVAAGNKLWVMGWRKLKTGRWEPRIEDITIGMFEEDK